MTNRTINYLDAATWAEAAATSVMRFVMHASQRHGFCSVMLTGGRSAERLYQAWSALPEFSQMHNVRFYFGDERCVPPEDLESNYGLAMRTLFRHGVPPSCSIIRMAAELPDRDAAAAAYEARLPDRLDILLLSIGEDGHIASLFPHSTALFETRQSIIPVHVPKSPSGRLTITPQVISRADHIFVMALGPVKAAVFDRAKAEPEDFAALPARLVLNAIWFLDSKSTN